MTINLMPRVPLGDSSADETSNSEIAVGDLWVISWNGTDLGLVLIAAVRETYALIWPVTDETVTPSAPCFSVAAPAVNTPLVGWPEAEAGMSFAALDRRLAAVASSRTMRLIYDWIRGGDPVDAVETYPERDDEEADGALELVCQFASTASDLEWPDLEREGVLDREALSRAKVAPASLKGVLGDNLVELRMSIGGERIVTRQQAIEVAERSALDASQLLTLPNDAEAQILRLPSSKHRVLALAESQNVSEEAARTIVWHESKQAARQQHATAPEAAQARVDAAFTRLGVSAGR